MSRKQGPRIAGMRPSAIAVECLNWYGIQDSIGKIEGITHGH